MGKYNERIVARIVSLIESDSYSIVEICDAVKITRKTFYEWKDTKPEFSKAIEQALKVRNDQMLMLARRSLKRKLNGYTLKETKSTYVPDAKDPTKLNLKTEVVRTKEYAPDTAAIRMVLERNDRQEEQDRLKRQEEEKLRQSLPPESTKEERLNNLLLSMNPKTEEHRRIVIGFHEKMEREREEYQRKQLAG